MLAASLFDSPWAVLVIILISVISNWLMKRRQANQDDENPADGVESPPPKSQEHSQRQTDLQEVLRQLLGGDPPPRAPQPPPIPPVIRDAQAQEVGQDEEQFQPEPAWMDESHETYGAARPPAIPAVPPPPPPAALARANAARIETLRRDEEAARRFEQLSQKARHPATAVGIGRGRRSPDGKRAIAMVRDPRTVRQAFIASVVFGPPKALER